MAETHGHRREAWSIVEVARITGVTSRTLRHYDAIGLLPPAGIGANGYRYYQRDQLLRLQEILLLRELGLGLRLIARVVAGTHDRAAVLRGHEKAMRAESARLARLADTLARTVAELEAARPGGAGEGAATEEARRDGVGSEGAGSMTPEEMFEGFAERQARYERQLLEHYGEPVREHLRTAAQRTGGWGVQEHADAGAAFEALDRAVLDLVRSGAAPSSEAALAVMERHFAEVSRYWTPDAESYRGLGELYVEDPEFRARYDAQDPRMAEWLREATAAYASARLG